MSATHPFEAAGLGLAPFKFVGVTEKRGPIKLDDGSFCGAPGQPMGCCDFCMNGIAIQCHIESSDGQKFVVGSDCVRKTHQKGDTIVSDVQREVRHQRKQKRLSKLNKRILAAKTALYRNTGLLVDEPHPNDTKKSARFGFNLRTYVEFLFQRGGESGKTKACKIVEEATCDQTGQND